MSRGFSLIEALVALVVLSTGLLGAAALLLGGLRDQSLALRHGAAAALVADVLERIQANPDARASYASGSAAAAPACDEAAACDAAALAAHDLAHFESAARQLLPHQQPRTQVTFEPATGPTTTDRYVISLTWNDARDPEARREATLILRAKPVAGAA